MIKAIPFKILVEIYVKRRIKDGATREQALKEVYEDIDGTDPLDKEVNLDVAQ